MIVSFAAVIRVVTQRFSPLTGGLESLRDDPNNGCEGDYSNDRWRQQQQTFHRLAVFSNIIEGASKRKHLEQKGTIKDGLP